MLVTGSVCTLLEVCQQCIPVCHLASADITFSEATTVRNKQQLTEKEARGMQKRSLSTEKLPLLPVSVRVSFCSALCSTDPIIAEEQLMEGVKLPALIQEADPLWRRAGG